MNWLGLSIVTLLLWGTYPLFANRSNAIHGEAVTMAVEALAMLVIALMGLASTRFDVSRVTTKSLTFSSVMAIGSSFGFYLFLKAIRMTPTRVGTIALITGLYPVITIVVAHFAGDQHMTPRHWLGAATAVVGLVLVSW